MIKLFVLILISLILILLTFLMAIYLASRIEDKLEKIFFWLMYIFSVLTFINIIGGIYYYLTMKNKRGPKGPQGERGDDGEKGESGFCNATCRNNSCTNSIYATIITTINELEKNYGEKGDLTIDKDLRNPYIKQKVKQICESEEYKQSVPFNGRSALDTWLSSIWRDVTVRIYESGGLNYFRSVGAEYDFDWLNENPWDEFKKYDVYYWGLGHDYRPIIIEKNNNDIDPETFYKSEKYPIKNNADYGDNANAKIGDEYNDYKKKNIKYSTLTYLNLPIAKIDNSDRSYYVIKKVNSGLKKLTIYNLTNFDDVNNIIQKYINNKNINIFNPLNFIISEFNENNSASLTDFKCYNIKQNNNLNLEKCNYENLDNIYTIEFLDVEKNGFKLFVLRNMKNRKFVSYNNNNNLNLVNIKMKASKFNFI